MVFLVKLADVLDVRINLKILHVKMSARLWMKVRVLPLPHRDLETLNLVFSHPPDCFSPNWLFVICGKRNQSSLFVT